MAFSRSLVDYTEALHIGLEVFKWIIRCCLSLACLPT